MTGKFALYGMLGLGALLFVSTAYAYVERERRQAAQTRAEIAEAQAQSRERAMEALQAEVRAARERAARYERIRQDVAVSPNSRACVDSPAVRAALRGLRATDGAAGHPAGADRGAASGTPAR
jgi:multidrug resistance efflux pump